MRGFCDQRGTLGDTNWAVVITYSAILGRVIRTQRELRKVDLSDMSKRLGFASVSSYSRLETGDVPITVNASRRLRGRSRSSRRRSSRWLTSSPRRTCRRLR